MNVNITKKICFTYREGKIRILRNIFFCSIQYVIISLIQDVGPFIQSQTEDENDSRVEEEDDGEQEAGTES